MTAIMMAATGTAAFTVSPLDAIVTVASDEWFDFGTDDTFFGFGYGSANPDPLGIGAFGSISEDTYVDASATSRVVAHIMYSENTGGISSIDDSIFFGIIGTSIPDTDLTFAEIVYNGVTYTRTSRTQYVSNHGGAISYWRWNNVSPNGPTSGTRELLVNL